MKKQTIKNMWIVAIVLILSLSIFGLFSTGLIKASPTLQNNVQVIGTPAFGWISCEPAVPPTRTMTPLLGGVAGTIYPSAFNSGDISDYTITISTPVDSSLLQDADRLLYSICDVNGNKCDYKDVSKELPDAKKSYQVTLPLATSQQKVTYEYQDFCSFGESGCTAGTWKTQKSSNREVTITGSYRPFSLFKHDTFGGGIIPLSETCKDPISVSKKEGLDLILSTTLGGINTKSQSTNSLIVGEKWNYISKPAILSLEEVETYNGQNAECINKIMYGFDTIQTSNGNNYIVVNLNNKLGTVDCCNSDILPNYQCINHKWVSKEKERACSTLKPCPMEGSWNVNTDDMTRTSQITQNCVDGMCVTETRKVECANSYACPEGYSCSDEFKCVQTSIVGGGGIIDTCGNGKCEGNENPVNCPKDCEAPSTSNTGVWIFVISLLVGTLISYFIIANYIPLKRWAKFAVVLILALIVGTIFAFLITLMAGLIMKAYSVVGGLF